MSENANRAGGSRWRAFGPGVLFAGIAVGASHLVQSTRAGADFGLALVLVIIAANVAKYPAFRFGAEYAQPCPGARCCRVTGIRAAGAIALYGLIAIGTMFAAVPAVTLVTAGLAQAVFGIEAPTLLVCGIILSASVVLLIVGGYPLLDRVVKIVMALLVSCTLIATVLVIPKIDWAYSGTLIPTELGPTEVFFIAALIGWMPTSIDITVWHSLWSVAKSKASGHWASPDEARWDFNIGFVGTVVLAICFVLLGAGTMHGKVVSYAPSAAGFAEQLISMYVQSLGAWSGATDRRRRVQCHALDRRDRSRRLPARCGGACTHRAFRRRRR